MEEDAMPAIRLRDVRAIVLACAGLLLAAGSVRADGDVYRSSGRSGYSGYSGNSGNSGYSGYSGYSGSVGTTQQGNASGPNPSIGVYRRSHDSFILGSYCDDPRNLETQRRFGRVSDDQYHFDPYGYRDDLGYYSRSYMDRDDGRSTRNPVSSDVPCSLSPVGAPGPVYRSPGVDVSGSRSRRDFDSSFSAEKELAELYEASGWTPLSDGRTYAALDRFARLVKRSPERGIPRVGLALATAELGERDRAVDLMRDALRVEADALYDVPVDERLRVRLAALGRLYPSTEFDVDTHFMRAAIRYLGGENESAHTSIERALARGDDSESTATLRRLIVERPRQSGTALRPGARSW